ncbi:MAG: amino acid permease [Kyrpidia sp.]|nr:amino acid permease [Kyrpidia sp.]
MQRDRQLTDGSADDLQTMQTFHYSQELKRTLKLFASFAVAFSFISITTGIFTNYSFVLNTAGPLGIWTWPIVGLGQFFVGLVFAELAGKIPLSGYSYQWVSRMAGPGWGWFVGWVGVCFLVLVVPAVDSGLAPILASVLGIEPTQSHLNMIVIGILLIQALLNIYGVRLASSINNIAVFTEAVGIIGLTVLLGILAVIHHAPIQLLFHPGAEHQGYQLSNFVMASLIGAFTLVGFEAAANLSEETIHASKTVPKAILTSLILSGVFGTLFLIAATLSIPDVALITKSDNPLPAVIEANLGSWIGTAFLVLVIISIFACGLVIMTSGSRLIYAMARDNAFFFSSLFKKISPTTGVPVPATVMLLIIGILATLFSNSLTLLVGAASVLPAILYLITVASYTWGGHRLPDLTHAFSLGRWGRVVAWLAIVWLVVEIGILTIPSEFHKVTLVAAALLAIGVLFYFGLFRRRIVAGEAGVHPVE